MEKDNVLIESKASSSVKDYIYNITKPIFDEVLKETPKNHMSVGSGSVKDKNYKDISLYQPHNYRLYFDFSKASFSPPTQSNNRPKRSVVTTYDEYKLKNSTEHYFKNFKGCNITVKKTQIEVINNIEHKRWYVINHGEAIDYGDQLITILEKKDAEAIRVLENFISEFGGKSNLCILKRKTEDKVQLEDSVDKIGRKNHFHGMVSKKVYNSSHIEFKDSVFTANYFENRAIEKITPEVLIELNKLYNLISVKLDGLTFLKDNFKEMDNLFKYESVIKGLSDFDKSNFEEWLQEKFSNGGDLCQYV